MRFQKIIFTLDCHYITQVHVPLGAKCRKSCFFFTALCRCMKYLYRVRFVVECKKQILVVRNVCVCKKIFYFEKIVCKKSFVIVNLHFCVCKNVLYLQKKVVHPQKCFVCTHTSLYSQLQNFCTDRLFFYKYGTKHFYRHRRHY